MASLRTLVLAAFAVFASLATLLQLHAAHARSLRTQLPTALKAQARSLATVAADDHAYVRPPASETGGFPNNTRRYHRAPCPCLNTLANHGFLSRDGKGLTPQIVQDALVTVLNVHPSLAQTLAKMVPPHFTLADLGQHNFIEHDASLVHDDAFFGTDPSLVNRTLANELFTRAGGKDDELITKRVLAHFRADRETECKRTDPHFDFGLNREAAAYAEAAAFLLVLGDYDSETISVAHARSFLVDEKFPNDFTKSETAVTTTAALYLAARLRFLASWPWTVIETA